MAKGGKGKALKTAKGKKAKHDANTAAQQVGAKAYVHCCLLEWEVSERFDGHWKQHCRTLLLSDEVLYTYCTSSIRQQLQADSKQPYNPTPLARAVVRGWNLQNIPCKGLANCLFNPQQQPVCTK